MTPRHLRELLIANYPIVDSMFHGPGIEFRKRNIDMRWYYNNDIPLCVSGFNPFTGNIFYGRNSFLAELIAESDAYVTGTDWYLYEAFFAAHDYVHTWCIRELTRHLNTSSRSRVLGDPTCFRDVRYILLVSEAAATIAIDYWLLCQRPIAEVLSLDGSFRTLTTPYRALVNESSGDARFSRKIRSRAFFYDLARAYCTNDIGYLTLYVDDSDANAPAWFATEETQAAKQQRLVADWLNYLSNDTSGGSDLTLTQSEFAKYADLTELIGELLWGSCFGSTPIKGTFEFEPLFLFPRSMDRIDFRFLNVRDIQSLRDAVGRIDSETQLKFFLAQYISCFDYDDFTPSSVDKLQECKTLGDIETLTQCKVGESLTTEGIIHLFIPN